MEKFGFENTDWNQIGSSSCNWNDPDSAEKREAFFSLSRFASDAEMELNQIQDAAKDASNSKKKAGRRSSSKMAALKPSGKVSREVEVNDACQTGPEPKLIIGFS